MKTTAKLKKLLKKENAKWPAKLKRWKESEWPIEFRPKNIKEVWRSNTFLVQIFKNGKTERMSVCRTDFNGNRWVDGIFWDDLQRLKHECGRGHLCAVEIYPPDDRVVNVANMRHLFILPKPPVYCW